MPGALISYADHCLNANKTGWVQSPSEEFPYCSILERRVVTWRRLIAYAAPDDLAGRLASSYGRHDIGHVCVAAFDLLFDDYKGHCGKGIYPLLRTLI